MSRIHTYDLAEDDDDKEDYPTSMVQEWVLGLGMSPPPSEAQGDEGQDGSTNSGSPTDGSKRSSAGSDPSSGPDWPSPSKPWTGDQIPFIAPRVIAGNRVVPAPDATTLEPPTAEVYHSLHGMVCGGAGISASSPSQPPPARSEIEFQLPMDDNPYYILAIRCAMRQEDRDAPAPRRSRGREVRPQFSITIDAGGFIYVGAVQQGDPSETPVGFELIARFPGSVSELSAQSVYKNGVLFVIASPKKESTVVEVPVLTVPGGGKGSNLQFQQN